MIQSNYFKIFDFEITRYFPIYCSHYPNQARVQKYPYGNFQRYLEDEIDNVLLFDDVKGVFVKSNLEDAFGLVQCDVLVPRDTEIPFLPYRTSSGHVLFGM